MMPGQNRPLSATTTALVATGTVLAVSYVTFRKRQLKKKENHSTLSDIQDNFFATGSDVLNLYRESVKNKTFVLTGATSGLGRQTAILLGSAGGHVILGVRSLAEGDKVVKDIQEKGGTAQVFYLDLSSLNSVREFVIQVVDAVEEKIDGLINNAGVYGVAGKTKDDGHQLTWQTNAMAPALLTELLLPHLSSTGRILNISSGMHKMLFGKISLKCPPSPKQGARASDYALSKACQILHAHELNTRFATKQSHRRAFAIHPGVVRTNIARHSSAIAQWCQYTFFGAFLKTVGQGCSTTMYCLLAPQRVLGEGLFYADCAPQEPLKTCTDPDEAQKQAELFRKLWNESQPQ